MAKITKNGDKSGYGKETGYDIHFSCPKCGCEFTESSKNVKWTDDRSVRCVKTRCPQCGKKLEKDV